MESYQFETIRQRLDIIISQLDRLNNILEGVKEEETEEEDNQYKFEKEEVEIKPEKKK